ncbi:DsbA family protein [Streptomyces sp. NPDC127092]|uniref:DsbA family protein n=1 Tax=Streptomyces sp. NPDC127092 TaxID=3347135 RepID=UPI00364FD1BA
MRVRGTGRAVVAVAATGLIALAAAGCSQGGGAADAALTVAAGEHADVLGGLPAAVDGAKIVVGEARAPHTVTVFVDPRCGYCAKFEAGSGAVLAERAAAGKVRVEYVVASFLDARTGGAASARAANALRAAAEADAVSGPGKFASYQAALYASRPDKAAKDGFSTEHLLAIAEKVPGLRGAAFDKAVREDAYREWVASAEKAFEDSGVGGTPTVLVDGEPLAAGNGLYDPSEFSQALRDAGV